MLGNEKIFLKRIKMSRVKPKTEKGHQTNVPFQKAFCVGGSYIDCRLFYLITAIYQYTTLGLFIL